MRDLFARFNRLPPVNRFLIALGVPLVAIAALVNRQRGSTTATGDEADAPTREVTPGAGAGVVTINPSAVGVTPGDLSSFSQSFTAEIGQIERRLAAVEDAGEAEPTTTEPRSLQQQLHDIQLRLDANRTRLRRAKARGDDDRVAELQAIRDRLLARRERIRAQIAAAA